MTEEPARYRQHRFTRPPGATEVVLLRHGESAAFDPQTPFPLCEGHGDPPLHPVGVAQAEAAAAALRHEPISAIYVTTLQRTHETAAPLVATTGLEPRVLAELREVHLGEWEGGWLRQHARSGHPLYQELLSQQRWDLIPGAEPHEAFRSRVRSGLQSIHRAHPDELVVAVVHGGVIGMALAEATGAQGFAFTASANASVSRLVVHGERWMVRSFNEVSHLRHLADDPSE